VKSFTTPPLCFAPFLPTFGPARRLASRSPQPLPGLPFLRQGGFSQRSKSVQGGNQGGEAFSFSGKGDSADRSCRRQKTRPGYPAGRGTRPGVSRKLTETLRPVGHQEIVHPLLLPTRSWRETEEGGRSTPTGKLPGQAEGRGLSARSVPWLRGFPKPHGARFKVPPQLDNVLARGINPARREPGPPPPASPRRSAPDKNPGMTPLSPVVEIRRLEMMKKSEVNRTAPGCPGGKDR
jgi:hypothetical protein